MKKALLITLITLLMSACAPADGPYKNGTYTGTSSGYGGDVNVSVLIEKGNIKEISVTNHNETPGVSTGAFENVLASIKEKNTTDGVDIYAGASFTSNALINAVKEAIDKAK
ncbi:MAG: FMN-binding protein [Erysipelothrix sp.]|nr:FMN-binding protein [Erysipelothrix sp.]